MLQDYINQKKAGKDPIFIKKTLKDLKILNVGIVMRKLQKEKCVIRRIFRLQYV